MLRERDEMIENPIKDVSDDIAVLEHPLARVRARIDADVERSSGELGTLAHDEWALDEALEETFPASDPPTPPRPGSTMAQRYAVRAGADGFRLRRSRVIRWILVASTLFFTMLWFRRGH
jgi:hypothetical protein